MYDAREKEVSTAMFLRWILKQKNPIARRNIQYIFSMSHNKDIKSVNSGRTFISY
jgi:hypothetical protein